MKKFRVLALSFIVLWSFARAFSQDSIKVVVAHPYIGDTLDAMERATYNLIPGIDGFNWAVFFERGDGTIDVKASRMQDGVQVDTILHRAYSRTDLWNHVQKVEGSFEAEGTGGGKDVIIYRKSGGDIRGSLLAVHDNSVIVSLSKNRSRFSVNDLSAVAKADIDRVIIEGGSNILHGMGIGGLIGGGVGMVAGLASGDDPPNQWFAFSAGEKAMMGLVAGGVAGALVGTIAGAVTSSSDETFDVHSSSGNASLRSLACYKDREPYVVRRLK